jgi:ubiquinone/menaquinone biosynthesis C-methylase UbiE
MVTPSKRNALSHFQRQSSTYERSWLQPRFFEPAQQAVLEVMEQHIPAQPNTVLDVGSGTGKLLRSVHERWPSAKLMGIDPTPGMVETARQLTPTATFEVGFAEALPIPNASVDVVVSTFSFHHWSDQGVGLREIMRVLRPQGYFILTDAVLPAWLARFFPRSHLRSPAQVQNLFQQVGLHILQQQTVVHDWVLITVGRNEQEAGAY